MSDVFFRGKNGIQLASTVEGRMDDPLVLLLHGGGQTRFSWNQTGSVLAAQGFYVVALDARGHGDSDWCQDGNYTLDDFKADLLEILLVLDRPAHLVGASLGGIASLLVAGEERGPAISSLVLVDVAPTLQKAGVDRIIAFMKQHPDGFADLEEVAAAVSNYLPHRQRQKSQEGLLRVVRKRADGRYYWHWDPAFLIGKGEKSRESRAQEARQRFERAAKNVQIPTLLLRGRLSDVVSQEDVLFFQKLVPQAESVDVHEAGHMVAGDSNAVFSNLLEQFLLKHR